MFRIMGKCKVFVNRILNMKKIKLIGLDMDHTLIRYHSENFESLVYQLVKEQLVATKHYPEAIKKLNFNYHDAIRGLVVDRKNGNILKLSRYGAIRQSFHGTKLIDYAGNLERLAMSTSSKIQVFGAEKSLFRHLTQGTASPRFGILFLDYLN